jgi:hypothetical protein
MRPRVEIAIDYLAAAVVTLSFVAFPAWVLVFAIRGYPWWLVLLFVAGLALARAGFLRLVRRERLLSTVGKSVLLLLGVTVATWAAAFVAAIGAYAIEISSSLCGGGTAGAVAVVGGLLVFLTVGSWALASKQFVLMWALPLAPVLGLAWSLLSLAVIPGGHGYCET